MHVSRKRSLFQVAVQCDVVFPLDSASAPTLARLGINCFDTAGSCVVGSSERDRNVLDEVDGVDWPSGGYSCSRESAKVEMQRGSIAQLELDESLRWVRRSVRMWCATGSLEVCSCISS